MNSQGPPKPPITIFKSPKPATCCQRQLPKIVRYWTEFYSCLQGALDLCNFSAWTDQEHDILPSLCPIQVQREIKQTPGWNLHVESFSLETWGWDSYWKWMIWPCWGQSFVHSFCPKNLLGSERMTETGILPTLPQGSAGVIATRSFQNSSVTPN